MEADIKKKLVALEILTEPGIARVGLLQLFEGRNVPRVLANLPYRNVGFQTGICLFRRFPRFHE